MSGNRYEALAHHADPVVREIGEQLHRGQVRPAALLAIPEYQRVIRRGLTRLAEATTEATRTAAARLDGGPGSGRAAARQAVYQAVPAPAAGAGTTPTPGPADPGRARFQPQSAAWSGTAPTSAAGAMVRTAP